MKSKQQNNLGANMESPQDMFGLGIQVFKIDSKKSPSLNSSAGHARQNMKNIECPDKKSSNISVKAKKTSGLLPSITDHIIRPTSKPSKQKVEKKTSSYNKIEIIKENKEAKKPPAVRTNKSTNSGDTNKLNQSKGVSKGKEEPLKADEEKIVKKNWRDPLNSLVEFYVKSEEFQENELTKNGRKRNSEWLGDEKTFIEGYSSMQGCFYDPIN